MKVCNQSGFSHGPFVDSAEKPGAPGPDFRTWEASDSKARSVFGPTAGGCVQTAVVLS